MAPILTVLLSVYNGERYLKETIDSVLSQTFQDFILLIIDDNSTDKTTEIIRSFRDSRIHHIVNEKRLGLSASVNKGIRLSEGRYIARLDADDICYPGRFEIQVNYLDSHPDYGLVAGKARLINQYGHEAGIWTADNGTIDAKSIAETLPFVNCIVQSSVMGRRALFERYLYDEEIKYGEDYELWMRMTGERVRIEKINEFVVYYRVHPENLSYEYRSRKKYGEHENDIRKKVLSKISVWKNPIFYLRMLYAEFLEFQYNFKLSCKYSLKHLVISSLVDIGLIIHKLSRDKIKSDIFCLFPYYHVGGAERVHADIVGCLKEKKPVVIFTERSMNDSFLKHFSKNARIVDFSLKIKNPHLSKIERWIIAGYIIGMIKASNNPVILSSNSLQFYNILPFIAGSSRPVDIIHAFWGGLDESSMDVVQFLQKRVIITRSHRNYMEQMYKTRKIEPLLERVVVIPNAVDIPGKYPVKPDNERIRVIFVSRNSPEKRPQVIGKIASECTRRGYQTDFFLVGDLLDGVEEPDRPNCHFIGEVHDDAVLTEEYIASDLILIVSQYEGFPMTVMEAMAHGVVPIATNVGGIPDHITPDTTGVLIHSISEEEIVREACDVIHRFIQDRELLAKLSRNCYEYAKANFSKSVFCENYSKLIGSL